MYCYADKGNGAFAQSSRCFLLITLSFSAIAEEGADVLQKRIIPIFGFVGPETADAVRVEWKWLIQCVPQDEGRVLSGRAVGRRGPGRT